MSVLILAPIAFLGSFVYGLTGFGSGLLTVPLASYFFDLPFVLAVFSIVDGINALRVWTSQPKAVSWVDAGRLLPSCVLGVAIGAALILWLPARHLMIAFGGFIAIYAIYGLVAPNRLPIIALGWAYVAGFFGGLCSAMFGAGGPPFAIYLSARPLPKDQLRATLAITSLVSISTRIIAFALGGLLSSASVWNAVLTVAPAALLALWLADRVHVRLPRDVMIKAIHLMLLIAGSSLLYRAITS